MQEKCDTIFIMQTFTIQHNSEFNYFTVRPTLHGMIMNLTLRGM